MADRSITQFLHFGAIDFSRPGLVLALVLAAIGLALGLLCFRPFALGSAVERELLPADIAAIGLKQFQNFGVQTDDQLLTALPVKDKQMLLFVRDQLGVKAGNQRLFSEIPGTFWEVVLRSPDDHITAFEGDFRGEGEGAGRLRDLKEVHHALLKIDEHGRWFQFYHRPGNIENVERLSQTSALAVAITWARAHPLIIPGEPGEAEAFDPGRAGEPEQSADGETYQFQWQLNSNIAGLVRRVTLEVTANEVSYYGLEYQLPAGYPNQLRGLWQLALGLRILLLVVGIPVVLYLLVKQLRRDAIDFHFSFTYSALLTFPLIALIIADLPVLINDGLLVEVKENFFLLSSATFLWLIMLLVTTPVVALTDSLVRQVWPEKLSTFDALIRGRFRLSTIGRAVTIGLSIGLALQGLISLTNTLLVRFGGYTHSMLLSTSISGSVAAFWGMIGSLGLALVFGYLLLFIATLVRLRIRQDYLLTVITGAIWLILLFATGRYSSLFNFSTFALITTAVCLFLLFRYDLLTLIVAQFAGLVCLASAQLLNWPNSIYQANGAAMLLMLAGIFYYSTRLTKQPDRLPEPEFVPQYITRLHSRERIERDIEIARQLQYQFLPQQLPQVKNLEVATLCRPAYEVGGDYYDFIELDDHRLGLVIADVSGKGIPAAFYMTMIKGVVQSRGLQEVAPNELLKQINWVIYKNTGTNTFVTLFYAIIDVANGTMVYSNAGHNPPLLLSRDGAIRELSCGGVVLGVMPQPEYQEETVKLNDGDLLILYTDGVIETTDVLGNEFGAQRLAATIRQRDGHPASHLITDICKALDAFAAGAPQADDITMILVNFKQDEKTNYRD